MKRIALFTLLIVALGAGLAFGAMKGSADVVDAKAKPPVLSSAAGERVSFEVKLDIKKKWHIYAHGDTNFIGVDLVPADEFPLEDFQAEYPTGHEKEFFGDMVVMIEGKEVITASALVPEGLAAGDYELDLSVTVQACDDKVCLAPAFLPVAVKLKVE
ncbi:MAG: protein-disulfide reductase DsbD domain-containing protein [Candidatus Krumholzibacteriota bacterium]